MTASSDVDDSRRDIGAFTRLNLMSWLCRFPASFVCGVRMMYRSSVACSCQIGDWASGPSNVPSFSASLWKNGSWRSSTKMTHSACDRAGNSVHTCRRNLSTRSATGLVRVNTMMEGTLPSLTPSMHPTDFTNPSNEVGVVSTMRLTSAPQCRSNPSQVCRASGSLAGPCGKSAIRFRSNTVHPLVVAFFYRHHLNV